MKIHLLIGHYRESYPGQHAPNVFLATDEFLLEENPEWWDEHIALEKSRAGAEVEAWAQVALEVDEDALLRALHPELRVIPAVVSNTTDDSTAAGATTPCPTSTHLPPAPIDANGLCPEDGRDRGDHRMHVNELRERMDHHD